MAEAGAIIAVGVACALLIWFGVRLRGAKRQTQFRDIADALALAWISADDRALRQRLSTFNLFSTVNASRCHAVLAGQVHGFEVTVLDYDYGNIVDSGFNPYCVIVFEADCAPPGFWLHPKGSLNSKRTGGAHILAPYPELCDYVLDGEEPASALLLHCASVRARQRWPSVAAEAGAMIYYEPLRRRPTFERISQILEDGVRARQLLPVERRHPRPE